MSALLLKADIIERREIRPLCADDVAEAREDWHSKDRNLQEEIENGGCGPVCMTWLNTGFTLAQKMM